jgi:hypothetical protein
VLQTLRLLWLGPKSALNEQASNKNNATRHDVWEVTPEMVAYAVIMVRRTSVHANPKTADILQFYLAASGYGWTCNFKVGSVDLLGMYRKIVTVFESVRESNWYTETLEYLTEYTTFTILRYLCLRYISGLSLAVPHATAECNTRPAKMKKAMETSSRRSWRTLPTQRSLSLRTRQRKTSNLMKAMLVKVKLTLLHRHRH